MVSLSPHAFRALSEAASVDGVPVLRVDRDVRHRLDALGYLTGPEQAPGATGLGKAAQIYRATPAGHRALAEALAAGAPPPIDLGFGRPRKVIRLRNKRGEEREVPIIATECREVGGKVEPCDVLRLALQPPFARGARQSGVHHRTLIDTNTGESRTGVYLVSGEYNSFGIGMGFCPFCGQPLRSSP